MNKKRVLSAAICALTSGVSFTLFSQAALAQSGAAPVEEVLVTGSRIKREDLTANSPISVIDAETLKLANTSNPEEFLRDDPRFVAAVGGNTNNGNDGAATVDLRNLGEARTLVLLDGKRFTPYDYQGFVDLSMIPNALIQRVEVITGGASAVYGSDAIGGVVNFIMKKDFSGVEFDYSKDSTFENDAKGSDMSLTFGGNVDDNRGNIVASLSYSKKDALYQGDRKWSEFQLDNLLERGGSSTHPNGTLATSAAVPGYGVKRLQFDDAGNLSPDIKSFNFNPYNLLLAPQEKYTGTVIGNYKITDTVEFFSRASFANNKVSTIIAPTGTFNFPYKVNIDNPFLTPSTQSAFAALDAVEPVDIRNDGFVDFNFGRRLTELGTRDSKYQNTTMQFEAGLKGTLVDNWDWELFAQKGRTSRTQSFLNDTSYTKTTQSMIAVTDPVTGAIVCADQSGGCIPVNYFGPGKITPEMANYIRLNLNETNDTEQTIYGGSISGDLPLTLPTAASAIGVAAGVEYRKESSLNRPDDNLATGNSVGFGASSPVNAGVEVTEYFAETRIPLIENAAFAKSIAIEAAVRASDYENTVSNAGTIKNEFSNTSYKFGGEWAINDSLRLRSLFQHAVRAPTMREIGLPQTSSTGDLADDYCDEEGPTADAALCEATGVPTGQTGTFSSIVSGQINNYLGGKATLKPEEADTITAGFVYKSEDLPFMLSVDYYEIEIDNVIKQVSEQGVLDACYLLEKDANGEFCSLIHRSALTGSLTAGTETGVDVSYRNGGVERVKGVDITTAYTFEFETLGSLELRIDAVNSLEHTSQDASILPEYDCVGLVGKVCKRPDPEWRFSQSTTWANGPLTVKLRWQYIGELKQDAIALGGASPEDYAMPTIKAFNYFDLYSTYAVSTNVTLRAGITNLFDKEPPITGNEYGSTTENSGNTFPATYDPLGRSAFVGVNLHF